MSRHDELNAPTEVLDALRQDTQAIHSPKALDQQILARARKQASLNAQSEDERRSAKRTFGFWHYCAAASAAGFLLVATSYVVRDPAMMDAAQPQHFPTAVIEPSATSPELVEEFAEEIAEAEAEAAMAKERSHPDAMLNQLSRERRVAPEASERAPEGSPTARKRQQSISEYDNARPLESLVSTDAISSAATLADAEQTEKGSPAWLADVSAQIQTVECQTLSIPDALSAQGRYLDAASQQALNRYPQLAQEITLWQQGATQQLEKERLWYQNLLDSPSMSAAAQSAYWQESWWQDPEYGVAARQADPGLHHLLRCAE